MPELNKDGLEPGQEVDFYTMQRVNSERARRNLEAEDHAPKKVRKARQLEVQSASPSNDEESQEG